MTIQKNRISNTPILALINNVSLAELVKQSLTDEGYQVACIENRLEAETMVQIKPSAVVLIEAMADEEATFSLVEAVLKQDPECAVILLSQKADQDLILRTLRTGAMDFLPLPFTRVELSSSVQKALDRRERRFLKESSNPDHRESDLDSLWKMGVIDLFLTSSHDLNDVLERVLDTALKVTGAEEGRLMILGEENGELIIRAQKHYQDELIKIFHLPNNEEIPRDVLKNGKPAIINNSTSLENITEHYFRSTLYVPLLVSDSLIGVLRFDNMESTTAFNEEQLTLVSTFAELAAIFIEQARLYQKTEQEFRIVDSILEQIDDAVIVVRPDFRIVFANRKARLLFDIGEEEIKGQCLETTFKEEALIRLFKDNHPEMPYTTEITIEEGYVLFASLVEIQELGYAVTLQDISFFKEIDRVKTEFVNTVSHDIRSPLTAILGYTQLISKVGEINPQQQAFIERIQDNIRNISDLANSLLELGRIESGLDIFREDVYLGAIVQQAIEELQYLVDERQQEIEFESSNSIPQIFGDPMCLRQVVENLIANAILYTPEKGKITVRLVIEGEQIIFQVIDNGLGIPSNDQPYIFDKFYRASNIPESTRGSGLGLAIVKSIVEKHQGRIWVNSQPGAGSCFTVVLPTS